MSKMKYNPLTGDFDYVNDNEGGDLSKPELVFINDWQSDREHIRVGPEFTTRYSLPNEKLLIAAIKPVTVRTLYIMFPSSLTFGHETFEVLLKLPDSTASCEINFRADICWDTIPTFKPNQTYRIKIDHYADADTSNDIWIGSFATLQLNS